MKKFPSPNLEIADNQMRNNISETNRMNQNQRVWDTQDEILDDVRDLGLRPLDDNERNRAQAIASRIAETR